MCGARVVARGTAARLANPPLYFINRPFLIAGVLPWWPGCGSDHLLETRPEGTRSPGGRPSRNRGVSLNAALVLCRDGLRGCVYTTTKRHSVKRIFASVVDFGGFGRIGVGERCARRPVPGGRGRHVCGLAARAG